MGSPPAPYSNNATGNPSEIEVKIPISQPEITSATLDNPPYIKILLFKL
nr:hypothetical protein [Flavobacterium covae]